MKSKATIVAKKVKKNLRNKDVIKEILNINEYTYFFTKVDVGRAFLDLHFPKIAGFQHHYCAVRDDEYFWAWWNLQWTNFEVRLMPVFISVIEIQNQTEWKLEMLQMLDAENINHSFHHNYIKKFTAYA